MHISRMVLHFRLDKTDKLWLLYCSSLRLANNEEIGIASLTAPKVDKATYDETKMNAIPLQLTSASDLKTRVFKTNHNFSQKLEKYEFERWYNWLEDREQNSFYSISYKMIIQGYIKNKGIKKEEGKVKKNVRRDNIMIMAKLLEQNKKHGIHKKMRTELEEAQNDNMPFIIKYLNPEYKHKTWDELLEDPDICNKTTYIWEFCYLSLTEFMLHIESVFTDDLKENISAYQKKKSGLKTSLNSEDLSRSSGSSKPSLSKLKLLPTK